MNVAKKLLIKIKNGQSGMALPAVLAMLVLGSAIIVPTINYVATSLDAGQMIEENIEGLYAADVGVEDALWRIKNGTIVSFPHSYQLTSINNMSVDLVVDRIDTIAGEDVGDSGTHVDYLDITKLITYSEGIYSYSMFMSNNGTGNIKIVRILIDFPPGLEYVTGSTGGGATSDAPTVVGNSNTGITLTWEMSPSHYPTIAVGETVEHCFQLSGEPEIEGVEGHGFVVAQRDDVGTVWDADSQPLSIIAQAKDENGTAVATIRAGVWQGSSLKISCWQVSS